MGYLSFLHSDSMSLLYHLSFCHIQHHHITNPTNPPSQSPTNTPTPTDSPSASDADAGYAISMQSQSLAYPEDNIGAS